MTLVIIAYNSVIIVTGFADGQCLGDSRWVGGWKRPSDSARQPSSASGAELSSGALGGVSRRQQWTRICLKFQVERHWLAAAPESLSSHGPKQLAGQSIIAITSGTCFLDRLLWIAAADSEQPNRFNYTKPSNNQGNGVCGFSLCFSLLSSWTLRSGVEKISILLLQSATYSVRFCCNSEPVSFLRCANICQYW